MQTLVLTIQFNNAEQLMQAAQLLNNKFPHRRLKTRVLETPDRGQQLADLADDRVEVKSVSQSTPSSSAGSLQKADEIEDEKFAGQVLEEYENAKFIDKLDKLANSAPTPKLRANVQALAQIARHETKKT